MAPELDADELAVELAAVDVLLVPALLLLELPHAAASNVQATNSETTIL
jgi:hypothetical protein